MTNCFKTWMLPIGVAVMVGGIAASARATETISLSRVVEVENADIDLSDLLPGDVVGSLRELAGTVGLGRSPQLGHQRTLSQRFIENQMFGIAELTGVLDVPTTVVVRRRGYEVEASDVQVLVEAALESSGCADLLPLRPGQLSLRSRVFYTDPEPSFEVLGVDLDSLRSEIQVRLRAGDDARGAPFHVTVPVAGDTIRNREAGSRCSLSRPGALVARRRQEVEEAASEAGPILARRGQLATLQAVGRGLHLLMTVVPLEDGRAGEVVRVRNTDTDGIVTARVIGQDLLERGF